MSHYGSTNPLEVQIIVCYKARLEYYQISLIGIQYQSWLIETELTPNAMAKCEYGTYVFVTQVPVR